MCSKCRKGFHLPFLLCIWNKLLRVILLLSKNQQPFEGIINTSLLSLLLSTSQLHPASPKLLIIQWFLLDLFMLHIIIQIHTQKGTISKIIFQTDRVKLFSMLWLLCTFPVMQSSLKVQSSGNRSVHLVHNLGALSYARKGVFCLPYPFFSFDWDFFLFCLCYFSQNQILCV